MTRDTQPAASSSRRRHWEARRARNVALGPKGVASAWCDQARALAKDRERRGDPTGWNDLVAVLQTFVARFPAGTDRRAENQRRHFEERLAELASAPAGRVALAWWDRARAVANDAGNGAWNDLALTLTNYCQRYGA